VRIFFLLISTAMADPAAFLDQLDSPDEKIREAAWDKLEDALNAGPPGAVGVTQHAESIKRVWAKLKPKLGKLAPETCSHGIEADSITRAKAELIIDLFGSMKDALPELQFAAKLPSARLAYFALRSLARQKQPLDRALVDRIARDDETRLQLYEFLRAEKLPTPEFTQEELARSGLVEWLVYPTELGCVPDEIALGKQVGDFYVFKFRGKDGKWLAGVSGQGRRRTFSKFEAWESHTAEQHLQSILATLDEWERKR
jgi:hypothetical protein